jgi:4-carboxymuconolactone decarboxylase
MGIVAQMYNGKFRIASNPAKLFEFNKKYYQEKGQPIQLLQKGDVVKIPAGVVHWHGATPDSGFTHIAINPNIELGIVTWLQRVTDEEYNSYK